MFNTNGVPTVWVFLALGVVLVLVFVKVLFGSLNQSLMAQPDTGAAWSILAPDTALAAQVPLQSDHPAVLHTRFGTKHGHLVRIPLTFIAEEGESLENALRRFKRKVQQEDIIKEIKKHSFYMKPGEKRRVKQALSRKRLRKKQRRELD